MNTKEMLNTWKDFYEEKFDNKQVDDIILKESEEQYSTQSVDNREEKK